MLRAETCPLFSIRLHAQLSWITATVRLCYLIKQLQASEYTCRWENLIIGQSMSYPGTIGGAVPISTSCNRATSRWPLYFTSNNKLPLHSREAVYKERDEATSLYILYMVYMIFTQTRCTMALLFAVISEERHCRHRCPSTSGSRPREQNSSLHRTQKSDPSFWNVYMQE